MENHREPEQQRLTDSDVSVVRLYNTRSWKPHHRLRLDLLSVSFSLSLSLSLCLSVSKFKVWAILVVLSKIRYAVYGQRTDEEVWYL